MTLWLGAPQGKVTSKFGGHRLCGSVDNIMVLVCHMILQDQVIKDSCDFIDRSLSS